MEVPRYLGKYTVESLLGQGSMGAAFKARQFLLDRVVALKVLPPQLVEKDPSKADRFETEARSAARLFHPNIVTIFDVGREGNYSYFAMQLVEGKALDDAAKSMSIEAKLDVFRQIALGLEEAHRKGVIHRDIKPSNVLLDEEGKAVILDFGIAKLADRDLTEAGMIVGSAPYMSPEQARGERVTWASDQFSLGAVMYEVFTGVMPFRNRDKRRLILERMNLHRLPSSALPVPIRTLAPDVPSQIEAIVAKCLRADRHGRYHSDDELLIDLERCRVFLYCDPHERANLSRYSFQVAHRLNFFRTIGPVVLAVIIFLTYLAIMVRNRPAAPLPGGAIRIGERGDR